MHDSASHSLSAFRQGIENAHLFPKSLILGDEFFMPRSNLVSVVVGFGFEGDVQSNVVVEIVDRTIQFGTQCADREEDRAGMAGEILSACREHLATVGSGAIVQCEINVVDEQRHCVLQGPDVWLEPRFNDPKVPNFAPISSGSRGGWASRRYKQRCHGAAARRRAARAACRCARLWSDSCISVIS